jgi:hypothetical protein
MSSDAAAEPQFQAALVERFQPVGHSSYDEIRRMQAAAQAAGFLTIR